MISSFASIARPVLWIVAVLAASATAQDPLITSTAIDRPASIACDAAYNEPCARTNSKYLARAVAKRLAEAADVDSVFEEINKGERNLTKGFYPFVFNRNTSVCEAHGAIKEFVGKDIKGIFNDARIVYSDPDALHKRFLEANNSWVRYLWSDGTDHNKERNHTVHSKLAFVVNVNNAYYLGVGYENRQLPVDLHCNATFDSWCSLKNVRSLVGKAQFRLSQAESLEGFEETIHDISFSSEFKLPGDFYLFMYDQEGNQLAHGVDFVGKTLADVVDRNGIGNSVEGEKLHATFLAAVKESDSTFVRYKWKDQSGKDVWKISFLVRVDFTSKSYYIGAGFSFDRGDIPNGPLGRKCSAKFNLPCSFAIALQLSSHALSHAISSTLTVEGGLFHNITNDADFKHGDAGDDLFYLFVYDVNSTKCVAHGLWSEFVGMTLTEVLNYQKITLNATKLHKQFTEAAENGGGWVLYNWPNSTSKKISYIFQINLEGREYYGGIGFLHERYPVAEFADGKTKNLANVNCTSKYNGNCSEVNTQAIVGQAAAELRLSSTEASVTTSDEIKKRNLDEVLSSITNSTRLDLFAVRDFRVSVFSVEPDVRCNDNGSGCCIASGYSDYVNYTWQKILDNINITSVAGAELNDKLFLASRTGVGSVVIPWTGSLKTGSLNGKKFWLTRFQDSERDFYVVSDYNREQPPRTCDVCDSTTESCEDPEEPNQEYCKPKKKSDPPITKEPVFIAVLVMFVGGAPLAAALFYRQKRSAYKKRRILEDKMNQLAIRMEHQMQGMFEVIHDLPIRSADEYRRRIGLDTTDSSSQNTLAVWYWKEDEAHIAKHKDEMVLTGTKFVSYSTEISAQIEHAYKLFVEGRGFKEFRVDLTAKITSTASGEKVNNSSTGYHYEINFETLEQKNTSSNHVRDVRREECQVKISTEIMDNLPRLPSDLNVGSREEQEDLLPTFRGQVIQVSKVHPDNQWLYGNVLYDPIMEDAIKQQSSDGQTDTLNAILAHALHDRPTSGWFPRSVTQPADVQVMHKLIKKLGGAGMDNLAPPTCWNDSGNDRVTLLKATAEYTEVANFFTNALYAQRGNVRIVNITRLQNLPLWQSYAVKKETMKSRDAANLVAYRVHNRDLSVDALERRWLFHGTRPDVIPKIVKQGFNRTFAGFNAVAYGRGVYFARDASYSIHPTYSSPDDQGAQYIFMCRVAVGDWSRGSTGILTPDPKPHNPLELFDSTVDNVDNPSIFVIYHDAQAYPDYLVAFKSVTTRTL